MKKRFSESQMIGVAIVAIGAVLLVLGVSAVNSGGGDGLVQDDGFPHTRDYYIIGGIALILAGGIATWIFGKKNKNVSSRLNPGPTPPN